MDAIERSVRDQADYYAAKFGGASARAAYAVIDYEGDVVGVAWSGAGTLGRVLGDAMNDLAVQHPTYWALVGTADGRWFVVTSAEVRPFATHPSQTVRGVYPHHHAEVARLLAAGENPHAES